MLVLREGANWDQDDLREALHLLGKRPDPGQLPTMPRQVIVPMVAEELAMLRAEMARLWTEIDGPDRAGAADRALILRDPVEARLFLRYHAESRTGFHRAFRELVRVLQGEAQARVGFVAASPNEPSSEGAERRADRGPIAAASPNEPSRAAPVVAEKSPDEPSPAPESAASPNEPGRA